ncbi:MAG: AbrB/MazE/SpoVT family DNA-binding domain-containing protein [Ardenticatenales bacterium]
MSARKQLTAVQAKGQVTIPAAIRRKLGLKTGDLVAFVETDQGVLLSPQGVVGLQSLDAIGQLLREQGVDLEDLITSGRDIRGELIKERYGLVDETP